MGEGWTLECAQSGHEEAVEKRAMLQALLKPGGLVLAGPCSPHLLAPPAQPKAGQQVGLLRRSSVPGAVCQGLAAPGTVLRRELRL